MLKVTYKKLALWALLTTPCLLLPGAASAETDFLNPTYKTDIFVSQDLHHEVPFEQEFNFQALQDLLTQKKITTVEGMIRALPDYMKNDNYVLMYRSRSLQEASPDAPRVIIFTPMASLVLSFNSGKATQAGSNTVEAIQFNRDSQRFDFHEISFDGKNIPKSSTANPKKCLSCHQSNSRQDVDMRPNWEPYSAWPGAFGSNDGLLSERNLQASLGDKGKPQDAEIFEQQTHESAWIEKFRKEIAPNNPRYSQLGNFNALAAIDLTDHLGIWNFMRAVRLMRDQKEIYTHYRSLLELTARCNTEDYLRKNPYIAWATAQPMRQYYHYGPLHLVSKMITDIFEPLGVDTSDWSMDFGTRGRLAVFERFGTPFQTPTILQYALHEVDPSPSLESLTCNDLQPLIDQQLGSFFSTKKHLQLQATHPIAASPPEKIAERCASCHASGLDAPFIPFDQPALLAKALRGGVYKRGSLLSEIEYRTGDMAARNEQMPKGLRLTAEEREVLLNYFSKL